jgi:UDP-4-amino-4,6-dideoxy-N-acetyl-beta-L-altrosamine N-acetyltransferase
MNVALREIRLEDKEIIYRWRNLPEVAQYMYTDHWIMPEEHERWIRGILKDRQRKYWMITHNQEDVGLVNLYEINKKDKRAYWSFYLGHPGAREKGVGSIVEYLILRYVFEDLHFNRLCCEVLATNETVIEMHKRFGFVQEGYLRQHVMKGGQPTDVVSLAILWEEWELQKTEIEDRLRRKGLL